jgi:predicted nucleotidyltransferase
MIGHKPQLQTLDAGLIQELVRRIVDAVRPERIVLFGSRGREDHRPQSDIDLLVIQKSNVARHRRSVPICHALAGLPVEVDVEVIVYTPGEVSDWAGVRQAFVTTALREGRGLYERAA